MNQLTRSICTTATVLAFGLGFAFNAAHAAEATMQPYVLAYIAPSADLASQQSEVESKLKGAGFQIVGAYSPYASAAVICITNSAMLKAAAKEPVGAFGAVEHVGLTVVNGKIQVAYLNPPYMAAAYHLDTNYAAIATALKQALGAQTTFGSESGRSAKDLEGYHYMVMMEYYKDVYQLGHHRSHAAAVKTIADNLKAKMGGTAAVYQLDIPGTDETIFGVSRANAKDSSANGKAIMHDVIDPNFKYKTTAYLPYEIVVNGNNALALHMRFRMAVWHPDLTMITFAKLMSSPGAIESLLKTVVAGKTQEQSLF